MSVPGSRGAGRHSMWQFAGRKCSGVVLMIVLRSAHSIGVAARRLMRSDWARTLGVSSYQVSGSGISYSILATPRRTVLLALQWAGGPNVDHDLGKANRQSRA